MKTRAWYRIENAASDPTVADIHIIDFIGDWIDDYFGFGVTAKAFIAELGKLPDAVQAIRVHINSPGGDVFAAVNIANALRDQQVSKGRTVETIVDGLAASAASIVMMAGSTVRMADNALVFVHNPWTIAIGNAAEMRKLADDLDTIRNTIIATYQWHSELSVDEIAALMAAESWLDADEAIEKGFATEKVEGLKAAASLDRRAVAKLKVPEKYRARVDALLTPEAPAPAAATPTEILRACKTAGCFELAEDLIAAGAPLVEVRATVQRAKDAKAQAEARATEIRALCEKANCPELAAGYIQGSMTIEAVRAHLTTITAKLDGVEIDGGLNPDSGQRVSDSWKHAFARTNTRRLGA